jgi:hypothetical protein
VVTRGKETDDSKLQPKNELIPIVVTKGKEIDDSELQY